MINFNKISFWISIFNVASILLCSSFVICEEAEETLPENIRNERAILGGHDHNEIVGGGSPGKDFPTLSTVPRTNFNCQGRAPGYYADEDYGCQVFHICHSDRRKDSFLCPNGTIFHQLRLVCDWWYNVDCSTSDLHVSVNNDIGKTSPARSRQNAGRESFSTHSGLDQRSQRKKIDSFQRETPTVTQSHNPSDHNFGVPLRPVSDIGSNAINDHDVQSIPREEVAVHVQERFPSIIQSSPVPFRTSPSPPVRSSHFVNNVTPRTGVTLGTFSNNVTPRTSVTLRAFTNNVTPRTGIPLPPVSNHFETPTHVNRVQNRVTSNVGIELPVVSNNFNNFRSNNLNRIHQNDNFKVGVPLPPQNTRNTLPDSIVPPEHFTVPKPGVSLSLSNKLSNSDGRGSTGRVSNARRILVNKTPLTNAIQRTTSRSRPRVEQNLRDQNAFNNIDNQEVIVLDDDKIATQFFNIGQPRVVVNRQPITTTSNVGIPLPQTNTHGNNIRGRGSFGVPLQTGNIQSNNRNNNFRNNVGVPLLAPNQPSNNNNNNNNIVHPVGIPLPQNLDNRNHIRTDIGQLHIPINGITSGRNNVGTSRGRLTSSNVAQNNFVSNQRSGINTNRGSTTFLTSQRNNARVNQFVSSQLSRPTVTGSQSPVFVNNQLARPAITRTQPGRFFVRDFDDDILDDLDDLNDPFDDDRFDDDRFDDDRFDDDRFDKDRFDDDKFDLDDRLDDLKDKLEDKFDNDRFDLDDKFESDRFDKDRFELDDRFDDVDDKLDDIFDFDDEIDDRLNKFGNDPNFNFGRRPRGSSFHVEAENTPVEEEPESSSSISIDPPSEIQLPPPPL